MAVQIKRPYRDRFFHLHRFENVVEQLHELICPPGLEWDVYQYGETRHTCQSFSARPATLYFFEPIRSVA